MDDWYSRHVAAIGDLRKLNLAKGDLAQARSEAEAIS